MNNIYKQLATKAADLCAERGVDTAWAWEEEYAKLIIKECLDLCKTSDFTSRASIRIEKHFGLESK